MKDVEQALIDFIGIFDQLTIPYAVMGGLAVRAYGVPRPTYDVDVTIAVAEDRLKELYEAVESAGYTVPEAYRAGWVDRIAGMPLVKFRIYRSDKSIDVDVFLVGSAYQRKLMERRKLGDLDFGPVWLISPEDLVLLKIIAGRPRDLGDIDDVRFILGALDETYLRYWAERLGILASLERILENPPV